MNTNQSVKSIIATASEKFINLHGAQDAKKLTESKYDELMDMALREFHKAKARFPFDFIIDDLDNGFNTLSGIGYVNPHFSK